MLKRSVVRMAPPKGHPFQRIIAGDFLGINWNKITFKAPYNNLYPVTLSAGQIGRMWSSPLGFGNQNNRMGRIALRMTVLMLPTFFIGFIFLFQVDWYQLMQCTYYFPGWTIPKWAQEARAEELRLMSWYKPGAYAKHHLGGQITIPGSEKLIS